MKTSKGCAAILLITSVLVVLAVVIVIILAIFLTKGANSSPWKVYYSGNFKILNIPYNNSLATSSSKEFSALANQIHTQLKSVYSNSGLALQFDLAQVVEFSSGSVKVAVVLQFKANAGITVGAVEETFQQSLTQVNASGQSGSLDHFIIDLTSLQFTEISKAQAEAFFIKVSPNISAVPNSDATSTTDIPAILTSTGKLTISPNISTVPNSDATSTTDMPAILTSTGKLPISLNISAVPNSDATSTTDMPAILNSTGKLSTCGSKLPISSRIVGGTASVNGEWPWQVSLQVGSHVCGASIISDRWLISAAHCFPPKFSSPSLWQAYMGSVEVGKGTLRDIKTIISHPSYGALAPNDNDIAVLELYSPLNFSNVIQPICLPSSSQVFAVEQQCTITGWGSLAHQGSFPDILQKANVLIINDQMCKSFYGSSITAAMLCAGILEGGVDSCQGDSGGPLACRESNGIWLLAGIVSFGHGCAEPNFPGVYTRVTAIREWVKEQTGV